jgi:hypothetical protein
MPYCMHCKTKILAGDKFCAGCGKPAVFPKKKRVKSRPDPRQNTTFVELSQEKQAAEEYYRAVGSRHPHIWPVSGIGSAIFILCLGSVMIFLYAVIGNESDLRHNPALRVAFTVLGGFGTLLLLNMLRYLFIPEVRPGSNPEMVGSKGDFLVFLFGIPLVLLAILGWLDLLDPLVSWIKDVTR